MSRERERDQEIVKKIKIESDHAAQYSFNNINNQVGFRGGGGGLNTITPCAACKLLRRRCAQECPFSPYFSPHEPHKFASVHKVFGASNVSKMLMEVPESQRADTANALVYEANVRLRDPVYGCMGTISALQHQVQSLQAELSLVRAQILKYKYTSNNNYNNNSVLPATTATSPPDHHLALLSSGIVSIALPPPPQPPPPPLLPPSSLLLIPHTSSSVYSPPLLHPPSSPAPDFTSISDDNNDIPFFG